MGVPHALKAMGECGRPSGRTVEIQNSSASVSCLSASGQGTAVAVSSL